MDSVTVLGTGAMGAGLVRTLIAGDISVTAWNRTPEKLEVTQSLRASCENDCAKAVLCSSVTMVCVSDYDAFHDILKRTGVASSLSGRLVINLSTGTPEEARQADRTVRDLGASYLDGAILCYPGSLGTTAAKILVAGPEGEFARGQRALACLGGDLRYLGPNIEAAAVLDLAFLSRLMAVVFGTIHGANVCESEGIPVADFAALLPEADRGRTIAEAIHDDNFDIGSTGAAVDVSRGALVRLREQAEQAGISNELPGVMLDLVNQTIEAGYGKKETASVITVLRARRTS